MLAASTRAGQRRTGSAWIAILALLINALVPTSFAVAATATQGGEAISGWCGSTPGHQRPSDGATPIRCTCCVLCSVAAIGLEPPAAIGIVLSTRSTALSRATAALAVPAQRSAYRAAQPRAPPAAAVA